MKNGYVGLSKNVSNILYGFAILQMVWGHLFLFEEKVPGWISLATIHGISIERIISVSFSCVSIFAFITGYGMCKKMESQNNFSGGEYSYKEIIINNVKYSIKKYISLMKQVWLVFIIFIPIGIIFFDKKWEFRELILNFWGISSSINKEWWYIRFYICLLLMFPLLDIIYTISKIIIKNEKMIIISIIFLIAVGILYKNTRSLFCFGSYIVFISGYLCARFKIFDDLKVNKITLAISVIAIIVLLISKCVMLFYLGLDQKYDKFMDAYTIPVLICAIVVLYTQTKNSMFWIVISFFGRHSSYIWLTHTFFCYYYLQRIIIMPKYSVLVFSFTLFLATISALALEWLQKKMTKVICEFSRRK